MRRGRADAGDDADDDAHADACRAGAPGASATPRCAPTAWPRCRARSPSPPTCRRRCGVGRDAALAAPVRPDRVDRPAPALAIAGVDAVITAADVPGPAHLRPDHRRPAGVRRRRRALRRRAGRGRGRRPPRDVPAGAGRDRRASTRCSSRCSTPRWRSPAITPPIHPDGNVLRHQRIVRGDPDATGDVVVEGTYEIGMQDQAFLGLEAALAIPDHGGAGRRAAHRHAVAARGPQADRRLPRPGPRSGCASSSAASAARSAPARTSACRCTRCLLALRTGRPVRMQYGREESFLGHVHRHPATDLDAPPRHRRRRDRQDRGPLRARRRRLRVHVVGGAAQRHHPRPGPVPVRERRRRRLRRPHQQPAVRRDAGLRRRAGLLRPRGPDGPAGRGVRARPGRDPPAQRHARPATGSSPARSSRAWRRWPAASARPRPCRCPTSRVGGLDGDPMRLPGGAGRTADAGHVVRGVGWGVAIKNLMYSEGFDDYSTARCRLADGVATLKFATAEVGQGFVTIAQQIARTDPRRRRGRARADRHRDRLGRLDVGVAPDVDVRRRGRRRVPGGARAPVRARRRGARARPAAAGRSTATTSSTRSASLRVPVAEALRRRRCSSETVEYHHRPTERPRRGRPGQLPHRLRLRRPPRRRRRRPRARPGEGGAGGHRARTSGGRSTRCR